MSVFLGGGEGRASPPSFLLPFPLLLLFQAFSSPNTKWLVVIDEGHFNRDLRVATRFMKKPT